MKAGDVVEVYKINRWGGHVPRNLWGVLIKRTYVAYDPAFSQWDVLINSKIINITERALRLKFENRKFS